MIFYIADENWNVTGTDDMSKFSRWFEKAKRHVALDNIGGLDISTVFLGIAHPNNKIIDEEDTMNYLFETMLFGEDELIQKIINASGEDNSSLITKMFGLDKPEFQVRYKTVDEARKGHAKLVELVKATLCS